MRENAEVLRDEVITCLKSYSNVLSEAGRKLEMQAVDERINDLAKGLFEVLFTGQFSGGKSTTLNALVGADLLKTSGRPETPIVVKVMNGKDSDQVKVYSREKGEPVVMSLQQFHEEFRLSENDGDPAKFRWVKHAEMQKEQDFDKTVVFVDSPGLGNTDNDDRIAIEYAEKADAIVFMVNATVPLNANDRSYIHKYYDGKSLNNVFFVINYFNLTQEPEELYDYVRGILEPVFTDKTGAFNEKLYEKRVFYVDSLTSFCARSGVPKKTRKGVKEILENIPPEDDQDTGIPEFEAALKEFLSESTRDLDAYRLYLPTMAGYYGLMAKDLRDFKEISQRNLDELKQELNAQETDTKKIVTEIDTISKAVSQAVKEIKIEVANEYDNFIRNIDQDWEEYFKEHPVKFGAVEIAKVAALNAKYAGLKLVKRADENRKDEEMKAAIRPIIDAVEKYVNLKKKELEESIAANLEGIVSDLEKQVASATDQLSGILEKGNIDMRTILNQVLALDGKSAVSGVDELDAKSLVQMLLAFLVNDYDEIVKGALGGGSDWGSFIGGLVTRTVLETVTWIIIVSFTGTELVYLIVRAVWGLLGISKAGKTTGAKILSSSREGVVRNMKNGRDKVVYEIGIGFDEKLTNGMETSLEEIKAVLNTENEKKKALIDGLEKKTVSVDQEVTRLENLNGKAVKIINQLSTLVGGKEYTAEEITRMRPIE